MNNDDKWQQLTAARAAEREAAAKIRTLESELGKDIAALEQRIEDSPNMDRLVSFVCNELLRSDLDPMKRATFILSYPRTFVAKVLALAHYFGVAP